MPRLTHLLAWLAADAADDDDGDDDARERRRRVWVLLDVKVSRLARACGRGERGAAEAATRWTTTPSISSTPSPPPSATSPPAPCPGSRGSCSGAGTCAIPPPSPLPPSCVRASAQHAPGTQASTVLAARRSLPAFALAHIGFSLSYARHFLPVANLALNVAENALVAPLRGRRLLRAAACRPVFAWTVNSERAMRWAVRQNARRRAPDGQPPGPALVDGVVTDDPALFLQLCRRYEDELESRAPPPAADSFAGIIARALRFLVGQLLFKLLFLYRRFWLRKLDYLPHPVGCEAKAD